MCQQEKVISKAIFPTNIEGFTIRFAQRKDVGAIFQSIKEMEVYTHAPGQVTGNEALLEHNMFDHDFAEAIIGEYKGEIVGTAVFTNLFSTFLCSPYLHLEDIMIREAHRGKGFGKAMMSFLADLTVMRGMDRFEWGVHDWNEAAGAFYKGFGAEALDDMRIYRLAGEALSAFGQEYSKES